MSYPRLIGIQYATGEIAPEGIKRLGQSRNDTQMWMCLKTDAVKNNFA